MLKRRISLLLSTVLLVGSIPAFSVHAADTIAYSTTYAQIGLLNRSSMASDIFMKNFVRKNSNYFNLAYKFKNSPELYHQSMLGAAPTYLNYDATFKRNANGQYWRGRYNMDYSSMTELRKMIDNGEIQVNFSAALAVDKHKNYPSHVTTSITDRAFVRLFSRSSENAQAGYTNLTAGHNLFYYENTKDDPDETKVTYGGTWKQMPARHQNLDLYFGTLQNCQCGSSSMSCASIAFADVVAPTMTSVKVTQDQGGHLGKNSFKKGESGFIHIDFSENLRLANNDPNNMNEADIKLNLKVANAQNGQEITGHDYTAKLIELKNNRLTFAFSVPETIKGAEVDHTIIGIEKTQPWVNKNEAFQLVQMSGSSVVSLGAASGDTTLTTSHSLFTDIAGNPIVWGAAKDFGTAIRMDAVAPKVKEINLVGDMISAENLKYSQQSQWPKEIDRSSVYAGRDDKISLTVMMTERISGSPENVKAHLNTGQTLQATAFTPTTSGVNGLPVTLISFETISAGAGAALPTPAKQIQVTSVDLGEITDLCGNAAQTPVSNPAVPKQQLFIDMVSPTASTDPSSYNPDTEMYWPHWYDNSDDPYSFYIPFSVEDPAGYYPTEYISGITGTNGGVSFNAGGLPFLMTLEYSPDKPADSKYFVGSSQGFDAAEGVTYYLHVKLLDDVAYSFDHCTMHVGVTDYAGNNGGGWFNIELECDRVAPSASAIGHSTSVEEGEAAMTIGVQVTDAISPIGNVYYQWTNQGDAAPDYNSPNWQPATLSGDEEKTKTFSATLPGLSLGEEHSKTLWVWVEDTESNRGIFDFSRVYDTRRASATISFDFDIERPHGMSHEDDRYIVTHPITVTSPALYTGIDTGISKTDATTLFLIKNPYGSPGNYFVKTYHQGDGSSQVFSGTPILGGSIDYGRWYNAEFEYTPATKTTAFADVQTVQDNADLEEELRGLWTRYYGELEVIVVTDYGDGLLSMPAAHTSAQQALERYTLYFSNAPENPDRDTPVHAISGFTVRAPNGTSEDIENGFVVAGINDVTTYDPNEDGVVAQVASSLDNVQFTYKIENILKPEWGIWDVDFEKSNVTLSYLGAMLPWAGTSIDVQRLNPGASEQIYIVPEGVAKDNGFYMLEINIYADGQSAPFTYTYRDIFLYNEKPSKFGLHNYQVGTWYKELHVNTLYPETRQSGEPFFDNVQIGTYLESEDFERENQLDFTYDASETADMTFADEVRDAFKLNDAYYKFWNAADENGEKNAKWSRLSSVIPNFIEGAGEFGASSYDSVERFGTLYAGVPLIKNQENIICYQISMINGYTSPVRQINVSVSDHAVEMEISLSAEKPESGVLNHVNARVSYAYSPAGEIKKYSVFEAQQIGEIEHISEIGIYDENGEGTGFDLPRNGDYILLVTDAFGSSAAKRFSVDYLDREVPTITVSELPAAEGEFAYNIVVEDNLPFDEKSDILLSSRYSYNNGDETDVSETYGGSIPLNRGGGEWHAEQASNFGIYYTNLIRSEQTNEKYQTEVEIRGIYRYIVDEPVPATVNRFFDFSACDTAGNISEVKSFEISNSPNSRPACIDVGLSAGGSVELTFNTLVKVTSPADMDATAQFKMSTDTLPIFANGEYEITFIDLFGNTYTQAVNVNVIADFEMQVDFSETGPTQDNVTVTISVDPESALTIQSVLHETPDNASVLIAGNEKSASVLVKENGSLTVRLSNRLSTKDYVINVGNIDRELLPVTLQYFYVGGEPLAGDTITTGDVIVGLVCDEPLEGVDGQELTYTFFKGGPASHTFYYTDSAGNADSITATLLYEIRYEEEPVSQGPPDYTANILTLLTGKVYVDYATNVASGEFAGKLGTLIPARGYRFVFTPTQTGVTLYASTSDEPPEESEALQGVTVSYNTVTVTENISFNVFLVNGEGEYTKIPINLTTLDNSIPKASIEYVSVGVGEVRAYLIPEGDAVITNTTGIIRDETSTDYAGYDYHRFTSNSEFTFYLVNALGATSEITAKVTWMDETAPQVKSVGWSTQDFVTKTSRSIIATLGMTRAVTNVTMAWKGGGALPIEQCIALSFFGNMIIVEYLQNAPEAVITFTAENGMSGTHDLRAISNIDKTALDVMEHSFTVDEPEKRFAVIRFTTNKPAYCAQAQSYNAQGIPQTAESFEKIVTQNGTYTFNLSDEAGNTYVHSETVVGIDETELTLLYNQVGFDDGGEQDAAYRIPLKPGDKICVKASKDCTITLDGATPVNFTAGTWGFFDIAAKDPYTAYVLTAKDYRDSLTAVLAVQPPDTTPPAIAVRFTTRPLAQDSSQQELLDLLNANVSVTDNESKSDDITLYWDYSSVRLDAAGTYKVALSAEDEKGNKSGLSYMYVRIFGPDELTATINGETAFPDGMVFIDSPDITLTLQNLTSGEPYTVSYRQGLKTTGQMKLYATKLDSSGAVTTFTVPGRGFYTIYVRTQSRKELIFNVNIII